MLTFLEIDNFKPFGSPQSARLAPLTLVYGPNSGGKSSIIQALLLLRQSFGDQLLPLHPLIPRGDYVDLGSFKALLHRHDLNRTLKIRLSFTTQAFALPRRGPASIMGFPLWPRSTRRVSTDFWAIGGTDEHRADHPQLGRLEYHLSVGADEGDTRQPLVVELIPASLAIDGLERLRLHREKNVNCFEWKDDESIRSYGAFLLSRDEVRSDLDDLWAGGTLVRALDRITGTRTLGNKARKPNLETLCNALKLFLVIGRESLPTILWPKSLTAIDSKERLVQTVAPSLDQFEFEFRSLLRSLCGGSAES